jgi:gliding motility-associated-like protein
MQIKHYNFLFLLLILQINSLLHAQAPNVNFESNTLKVCLGSSVIFENKTISGKASLDKSLWDFGDGIIVTMEGNSSISHTYSKLGFYTIELYVIDKNGSSNKKRSVNYIEVIPVPIIEFDLLGDNCHLPTKIKAVNKSLYATDFSYVWDFGNGMKSSSSSPDSISYLKEESYVVSLQLINAKIACNASLKRIKKISLYDFKGKLEGETIFCERETKKIVAKANYLLDNVSWKVINGTVVSSMDTGFVTVNQSGNFILKAEVYSKKINCPATFLLPITIKPSPLPTFTANKQIACPGSIIQFTETTSKTLGYTDFKWSYGDNSIFVGQKPMPKSYEDIGDYTVTLSCKGANGCTGSIQHTNFIKIQGPVPSFSVDKTTICAGGKVQISPKTDSISNCVWDFGDGTYFTGNKPPLHTYLLDSSYTVSLKCIMANGCIGKNAVKNLIVVKGPKPYFKVSRQIICPGMSCDFLVSDSITNCQWAFGDGKTATNLNPSHTYDKKGKYAVTLKATYKDGCLGKQTIDNFITVTQPIANFLVKNKSGCDKLAVTFNDSSSNPVKDDPFVSWQWDFGNGKTSTDKKPLIQYFNTGIYDVKLTVTTKNKCSNDTVFKKIIEVGKIDAVKFTNNPTSACKNLDVSFAQNVIINAPHSNDEVKYYWDFGGSSGFSDEENPKHRYSQEIGFYDVKLVVDFRGCKDSLTQKKAVEVKPSKAFFDVQKLYCNPKSLPVNVMIKDKSISNISDNIVTTWDFGDGKSSTNPNVNLKDTNLASTSHTYSDYGTYSIKQTINNLTSGCIDTISKKVHISWVQPDLVLGEDSVCTLSSFQLKDNSATFISHPIQTCTFLFGDGNSLKGDVVNYAYSKAGQYAIFGVPINTVGCSDTTHFAKGITVLPLPFTSLTADKKVTCKGKRVNFGNNSYALNGGFPLKTFYWSYSNFPHKDTTFYLSDSVNMQYFTLGDFFTSLVVEDKFGCRSRDSVKIQIKQPNAEFTMQNFVCNNQVFKATINQKNIGGLNTWIVDNNMINVGDILEFSFQEPSNQLYSTHRVELAVIDSNSCYNMKESIIQVSHPQAGISYTWTSPLNDNLTDFGQFKCPPITATYLNTTKSIGKIDSSNWKFWIGKSSELFSPQVNYFFPGKYSVSLAVVDEFGCKSDTTILNLITVLGPQAVPNWVKTDSICGQSFRFNLTNLENVSGISWYLDKDMVVHDSMQFNYSFLGNNAYSPYVILTDSLGCNVTYYTDSIIVPDLGIISKFYSEDKQYKLGELVPFMDVSSKKNEITKWEWDFVDSNILYTNFQDVIRKQYATSGEKTVKLKVTNAKGCFDRSIQTIQVVNDYDIPNVITPNEDGINDQFELFEQIFVKYNISIFNRWGTIIFQKMNQTDKIMWDGKVENKELSDDGVYFYVLDGVLLDGTPFKKTGNVSVLKN